MRLSARRLALGAAIGIAFFGCKEKPPEQLVGNGVTARATRQIGPFSRLSVGSQIQTEVTIGTPAPLELQGDGNILPHVTHRVENGMLTLDTDIKVKPAMRLRARIGVARLDAVSAANGAGVDIRGLAADRFEAKAMDAAKLSVSGTATALVLEGGGATLLDFRNVPTGSATLRLERAAVVELGYLETLDAKLLGANIVRYDGSPKIKQEIKFPSRLIQRDR